MIRRALSALAGLVLAAAAGAQTAEIQDYIREVNVPTSSIIGHSILDPIHLDTDLGTSPGTGDCLIYSGTLWGPGSCGGAGGGAPTDAQYWTGASDGTLSAEKNLGALSTGLVINTAGVPSAYTGTTCTDNWLGALDASGAGTCSNTLGASTVLTWSGRSTIQSPADAKIDLRVNAGTAGTANTLCIDGCTSAGVGLRATGTTIETVRGDISTSANHNFQFNGGFILKPPSVHTSDYTVDAFSTFNQISGNGGAVTATLPAAAGSGQLYVFDRTDSNTGNAVTIARAGTDTIAGATSVTLTEQYDYVILMDYSSSGWVIVSRKFKSASLDSVIGSTQGTVAYRGSSSWAALTPGTAGQGLMTGGSSANPSWFDFGVGSAGSRCADEIMGSSLSSVHYNCAVTSSRGSGSAQSIASTGSAGHYGIETCSTGTTATISCAFVAGGNSTNALSSGALAQVVFGSGRIVATVWAKIQTLPPDTTDNAAWYMAGFSDEDFTASAAAEAVDGYYFRYTKGANSDKWLGVARSNSAEQTCDTTATADTNFHNFTTDLAADASSVGFYIDGTLKCTISTGIPSGAGRESNMMVAGVQRTSGTTTARLVQLDAYDYHFYYSTPR